MKTTAKPQKVDTWKSNRGIAAVYIAILLVALLAFVGLAIDIGYMYIAKTQLQNAADAAAHAGASKLLTSGGVINNLSDPLIAEARNEAVKFALENKAAKESIVIESDGSNALSNSNDVTVGYWDGTTYTPNLTPVNAVQARCRRNEASPGGKIAIFFGKIIGISEMAASASAIAALPVRGGVFISLCIDTCGSTAPPYPIFTYSNGQQFDTGPSSPYDYKFAWTTLLYDPTAANKLSNLICSQKPVENVCEKNVYTTMGTDASSMKDFASAFYDTNYDSDNKTFTTVNGQKVTTSWEVIIPITNPCPPGSQGKWDPKYVQNYARATISAVCATGSSAGCFGHLPNLKSACNNGLLPRKNCCDNFDNNSIVIEKLQCVSCSDQSLFSGTRPVLVK